MQHIDETPVSMLDPGAGKTKKAYVWGYARSVFDAQPCVVYEFCAGRGAKYPVEFLKGWNGTIVCDDYKAYETVVKIGARREAGCAAHARRKVDELDGKSAVGTEAIRRFERIYRIERAMQMDGCNQSSRCIGALCARAANRRRERRPNWIRLARMDYALASSACACVGRGLSRGAYGNG